MKLPAAFVLFGLILMALSALADESKPTASSESYLTAEEEAALRDLPKGIDRKPGILDNWQAQANIFTLDDLPAEQAPAPAESK